MQSLKRSVSVFATLAMVAAPLTALGVNSSNAASGGFYKGPKITIQLSGPNQWNNNAQSFGPEWDKLVKDFHTAEPNITVKTDVQPLTSFYQTNSTALAAGTAADLVFNQAKFTPDEVVNLDSYLKLPNPYIAGNKQWYDAYDHTYFGYKVAGVPDANGHITYIPFNLIGIGVFANKDLAAKAGVTLPIQNFTQLFSACTKFRAAGISPWGWDNSFLPISWTWRVISSEYMQTAYTGLDTFKADGTAGQNTAFITPKSMTKAIKTGTIKASDPAIQASLAMLKKFVTNCATPNWSGVTNNNGAVTDYDEFFAGKAAMTWGVSFGLASLQAAKFKSTIFPFPTIDKAADPASPGLPARWGIGVGGTSYMIPITTKGDKLNATIKFLQFMSGSNGLKWAGATGGISPIKGKSSGVDLGAGGAWGQSQYVYAQAQSNDNTVRSVFDGLLLGNMTQAATTTLLQSNWDAWAKQSITDNKWSAESWATS